MQLQLRPSLTAVGLPLTALRLCTCRDEKKGITKVPAVLGNVWKKVATKKGDKVPKEPPAKS